MCSVNASKQICIKSYFHKRFLQKWIGPQHAHMCRMRNIIFWRGEANCGEPSQIQYILAYLGVPRARVYSRLKA